MTISDIEINEIAVGSLTATAVYLGAVEVWSANQLLSAWYSDGTFQTFEAADTFTSSSVDQENLVKLVMSSKVKNIDTYALNGCTTLSSVSAPKAKTVGTNALCGCTALEEASFPKATACGAKAFMQCTSLTAVDMPEVSSIGGDSCFQECSALAEADFPKLARSGGATFSRCTSLKDASTQKLSAVGSYSFSNCFSLSSADISKAASIGNYAFNGCSSLTYLKVPSSVSSILTNAFAGCTSMTCLYFKGKTLEQVQAMANYPWGLADTSIISVDTVNPDLLMHFDGINNLGTGDEDHTTNSQTWANAEGSLEGYCLKRPSTTYNTSWDDKGAVFTGAYDQAFWLTDPQGNTVQSLSSVDTGSFTYTLAFYYDPSTVEQWRGLIGRQGHDNSTYGFDSFAYVCTNPNPYGVKIDINFGRNGESSSSNQQSGPDLRSYLVQNSFNTIAFAYDESADTLKSFVNGQLVDTTNLTAHPPFAQSTVFVLGSGAQSVNSNRTCKGKIYDFQMYSTALDDSEVIDICNELDARYNS